MEIDFPAARRLFNALHPAPYLILLWLLAWLALRLIARLQRALKIQITARGDEHRDRRRVETLMSVLRYAANVVILGAATMWTLSAVGISITPLLATAGVAGIAIGFGAQSLVKDFFTGLFLLIENQISEGDMVEVAGKAGYVERVTLRHLRVRDYDGSLHFIPNSMITAVTNRSRDYSFAVIDIEVRREENIERMLGLIRGICSDMRADPALGKWMREDIDVAGVEKINEASILLRGRIKVEAAMHGRIRTEFLRRLKQAIDSGHAGEEIKSAG